MNPIKTYMNPIKLLFRGDDAGQQILILKNPQTQENQLMAKHLDTHGRSGL